MPPKQDPINFVPGRNAAQKATIPFLQSMWNAEMANPHQFASADLHQRLFKYSLYLTYSKVDYFVAFNANLGVIGGNTHFVSVLLYADYDAITNEIHIGGFIFDPFNVGSVIQDALDITKERLKSHVQFGRFYINHMQFKPDSINNAAKGLAICNNILLHYRDINFRNDVMSILYDFEYKTVSNADGSTQNIKDQSQPDADFFRRHGYKLMDQKTNYLLYSDNTAEYLPYLPTDEQMLNPQFMKIWFSQWMSVIMSGPFSTKTYANQTWSLDGLRLANVPYVFDDLNLEKFPIFLEPFKEQLLTAAKKHQPESIQAPPPELRREEAKTREDEEEFKQELPPTVEEPPTSAPLNAFEKTATRQSFVTWKTAGLAPIPEESLQEALDESDELPSAPANVAEKEPSLKSKDDKKPKPIPAALHHKRIIYPYSANLTSSTESKPPVKDVKSNKHLLEIYKDEIRLHATRRVELFFMLLIVYAQKNLKPELSKTVLQHGQAQNKGLKRLSAAHRSLITSLKDDPKGNWILAGTSLQQELNATDLLPHIVNQFDALLERDRKKYLAIIHEVSAGKIDPLIGLLRFLKILKAHLKDIELYSKYDPEILPQLLSYTREGSFQHILKPQANDVLTHYFLKIFLGLNEPDLQLEQQQLKQLYLAKMAEIQTAILSGSESELQEKMGASRYVVINLSQSNKPKQPAKKESSPETAAFKEKLEEHTKILQENLTLFSYAIQLASSEQELTELKQLKQNYDAFQQKLLAGTNATDTDIQALEIKQKLALIKLQQKVSEIIANSPHREKFLKHFNPKELPYIRSISRLFNISMQKQQSRFFSKKSYLDLPKYIPQIPTISETESQGSDMAEEPTQDDHTKQQATKQDVSLTKVQKRKLAKQEAAAKAQQQEVEKQAAEANKIRMQQKLEQQKLEQHIAVIENVYAKIKGYGFNSHAEPLITNELIKFMAAARELPEKYHELAQKNKSLVIHFITNKNNQDEQLKFLHKLQNTPIDEIPQIFIDTAIEHLLAFKVQLKIILAAQALFSRNQFNKEISSLTEHFKLMNAAINSIILRVIFPHKDLSLSTLEAFKLDTNLVNFSVSAAKFHELESSVGHLLLPYKPSTIVEAEQLLNELERLDHTLEFSFTGLDHPQLIPEQFLFDLRLSLRFSHDWDIEKCNLLESKLPKIYKIFAILPDLLNQAVTVKATIEALKAVEAQETMDALEAIEAIEAMEAMEAEEMKKPKDAEEEKEADEMKEAEDNHPLNSP